MRERGNKKGVEKDFSQESVGIWKRATGEIDRTQCTSVKDELAKLNRM
jgi:hypothetical protein